MYYIQGKARKNSKTYGKFIAKYETLEEVMSSLTPHEIEAAASPYLFTHIQLPNERVITQTVPVGGRELTCTPQKLWDTIQTARN